jgi:hypothetical protein
VDQLSRKLKVNINHSPLSQTIDGQLLLSKPGVLSLAVDGAYSGEQTNDCVTKCVRLINQIMAKARAGGFKQSDIAQTIFKVGSRQRVEDMVRSVCACIDNDEFVEIVRTLRIGQGGQQ